MQWQRAKPWVPGTEKPRGLVSVAGDPFPLRWCAFEDGAVNWDSVSHYRLPATPEGRREADRIRKANARATAGADESSLVLPLPQGTRDALNRVCARAGFTDRRELLATLIHNLDGLDCPTLEAVLRQTVRLGDLSPYFDRLQEVDPDV
jgi:hypothetical protein